MRKNSVINLEKCTGLANKTGTWRNSKPIYVDRLPPCNLICPAGENIQKWLGLSQEGDFKGAWEVIVEDNPFPAIMGRVCYHTCEKACNRNHFDTTVNINILEKFIGDNALKNGYKFAAPQTKTHKKIAIVGAGPAGLSAAYFLAKAGHEVIIFEEKQKPGGMLRYGVPSYRLARDVLDAEIQRIFDLGIELKLDTKCDEINQLKREFDVVIIASGAHRAVKLDMQISNNANAFDAVDLLKMIEDIRCENSDDQYIQNHETLQNLGDDCVVYGGGNTAIDVARTLVRLKKRVKLLYRREKETMSAHESEIEEAVIDGVEICQLHMICAIDGKDLKIEHMTIEDGELKHSNNFETLRADSVFFAVGQSCEKEFFAKSNIKLDKYFQVVINDQMQVVYFDADCDNVFAAGDIIQSKRNVTVAIGDGKKLAKCVNAYLNGQKYIANQKHEIATIKTINKDYYQKTEAKEIKYSKNITFKEVGVFLSNEQEAKFEARRCFSCGNCFECDNCYGFCPDNAIVKLGKGKRFEFNYDYCKGCGICASECPCGAIKMVDEDGR